MTLHVATFDQLTPAWLYALLRLRSAVFVVEQRCLYEDIDGRDTEPGTRHVWRADGDTPLAYLRILSEPDGTARIGRVCVAPPARGTGLARRLMTDGLELLGDRPCVLDAQAHLAGFYAGLGFLPTGPEFDEDGIPHVPMRRPDGAGPAQGRAAQGRAAQGRAAQGRAATSSAIDRR